MTSDLELYPLYLDFTDLATSIVTEKQSIAYSGSFQTVRFYVERLTNQIADIEAKLSTKNVKEENKPVITSIKVFDKITLSHDGSLLTLEVYIFIYHFCCIHIYITYSFLDYIYYFRNVFIIDIPI